MSYGIRIKGVLNNREATKLEKLAKAYAYRFGIYRLGGLGLGKTSIDMDGYHVFRYIFSEAKVRFTPNNNQGDNQLDFSLIYWGRKARSFFKAFQRKFGKIDESKIEYY